MRVYKGFNIFSTFLLPRDATPSAHYAVCPSVYHAIILEVTPLCGFLRTKQRSETHQQAR